MLRPAGEKGRNQADPWQPYGSTLLKVLDFGAVRQQCNQHTATHLGADAYAAPEQRGPILRKLAEKSGL